MNTREIILDILLEWSKGESYCHLLIRDVLNKYDYLEKREKAFIKKVAEGVVERKIELDYVINLYSKTKVNKLKPLIREVLRMSVYQILYMEQVPDSAVCNEAVKLVEKRKFYQLKGFVNGVLRNIVRNKEQIVYPDICTRYSIPQWLQDSFMDSYDEETIEKIFASFLEEKPISIRMKETLSEEKVKLLISDMEQAGMEVEKQSYLPYAYNIKKAENLQNIAGFLEGDFTVQDSSSMLVAECSGVKKGQIVLDLCASPGGKSMHMAEKLQGTGMVYAYDISKRKVDYIEENITRLGYQNVKAAVNDATIFREELVEKADVVLADVLCSGIGVIGKKCDIKYRINPDEIKKIVLQQKSIMKNAWQYVKKGGTLIYSTCTISRAENEEMVQWMLENMPLELESLNPYLPKVLHSNTTEKGYLQLLPGIHKCDGFFIAKFRRVE